jgi:hypothetical protein
MKEEDLNIGNSIYPGLNDNEGIMLCGYEWGGSEEDAVERERPKRTKDLKVVFSNKEPHHGPIAWTWRYDTRIVKWFGLWGHPLSREGEGHDFEKCILQTNWCDTQNVNMTGDYYQKLLQPDQIENFVQHIAYFKPRLLLFFGIKMISIMQQSSVLPRLEEILGKAISPPSIRQEPFQGKRFRIGFQKFENCDVIGLPHPSGSQGLQDEYIQLFSQEIGQSIAAVKRRKGLQS